MNNKNIDNQSRIKVEDDKTAFLRINRTILCVGVDANL